MEHIDQVCVLSLYRIEIGGIDEIVELLSVSRHLSQDAQRVIQPIQQNPGLHRHVQPAFQFLVFHGHLKVNSGYQRIDILGGDAQLRRQIPGDAVQHPDDRTILLQENLRVVIRLLHGGFLCFAYLLVIDILVFQNPFAGQKLDKCRGLLQYLRFLCIVHGYLLPFHKRTSCYHNSVYLSSGRGL